MNQLLALGRMIVRGQTWTPLIANTVINALVGWLTFRDKPRVSVWGANETVFADLLGTSFFLPFITSLVASLIISRAIAAQQLAPIKVSELPSSLHRFRGNVWIRSARFGVVVLMLAVGPVGLMCFYLGRDSLPVPVYVGIKVVYAVILGIIVTPLIAAVAQSMSAPM